MLQNNNAIQFRVLKGDDEEDEDERAWEKLTLFLTVTFSEASLSSRGAR